MGRLPPAMDGRDLIDGVELTKCKLVRCEHDNELTLCFGISGLLVCLQHTYANANDAGQ